VVAINKIDKPEANIEKAKQELANQLNLLPEDWGGKVVTCPISAKQRLGIEDLLDTILLLADLEESNRLANPGLEAIGTIVESHVNKSEGPVATVLVQNGTLKIGDTLICNEQYYGHVRALKNYRGQNIEQAGPSTPVKIIGLKATPEIGDVVRVGQADRSNKVKAAAKGHNQAITRVQDNGSFGGKTINLIVKTDVFGSGEAIEESLLKLNNEEVAVRIIHRSLGNITEGDITRAEANQARVIGFNVKASAQVEDLARGKEVVIEQYEIIYDLINKIKKEMQDLMQPEIKRVDLGRLKVLAVFRFEGDGEVVGGKVLDGSIKADCQLEIVRNKEIVGQGKLLKLQSGRQDVSEILVDQEGGLQVGSQTIVEVGDILQAYREDKLFKKM